MGTRKREPRLWMAAACARPIDDPEYTVFDVLLTENAYADKRQALKELKVQLYLAFDPEEFENHQIIATSWANLDYFLQAFGVEDGVDGDDDDEATPVAPDPEDHGADVFQRELVEIPAAGDVKWKD